MHRPVDRPVPRESDALTTQSHVPDDLRTEALATIQEAVRTRTWEALEGLVDRLWFSLESVCGEEFLAATALVSDAEMEDRPQLMVGVLLSTIGRDSQDDASLHKVLRRYVEIGARYATRLETMRTRDDLLAAGAAAVTAVRFRRRFEAAEQLGAWIETTAARLPLSRHSQGGRARLAGWLSLQRGLTATLAGDLTRASAYYTQAVSEAGEPPYRHFAGINASANLALIDAVNGRHESAQRSLDAIGTRTTASRADPLLTLGATLARGFTALDSLDLCTVTSTLDAVGDDTHVELWPFVASLRAGHDLLGDEPSAGLHRLDSAHADHGLEPTDPTVVAGLLQRARVELLARAGQVNRALRAIETSELSPALWLVPEARIHLLAGHHQTAFTIASRGVWHSTVSRSDLVELHLVRAAAALADGLETEAKESLAAADTLGARDTLLRGFALLPSRYLSAFGHVGFPLSTEALLKIEATRTAPYRPVLRLVALTARERTILHALAQGGSTTDIASRLFVSVNTVRTQVKSIYRKLGVSSKHHALARAQQLGLIDEPAG